MSAAARRLQPHFIVTTGDVLYPSGLTSASDPVVKNRFESVYSDPALRIPWHITLGNHGRLAGLSSSLVIASHGRIESNLLCFLSLCHRLPGLGVRHDGVRQAFSTLGNAQQVCRQSKVFVLHVLIPFSVVLRHRYYVKEFTLAGSDIVRIIYLDTCLLVCGTMNNFRCEEQMRPNVRVNSAQIRPPKSMALFLLYFFLYALSTRNAAE